MLLFNIAIYKVFVNKCDSVGTALSWLYIHIDDEYNVEDWRDINYKTKGWIPEISIKNMVLTGQGVGGYLSNIPKYQLYYQWIPNIPLNRYR